jgi:hypothetical protein
MRFIRGQFTQLPGKETGIGNRTVGQFIARFKAYDSARSA